MGPSNVPAAGAEPLRPVDGLSSVRVPAVSEVPRLGSASEPRSVVAIVAMGGVAVSAAAGTVATGNDGFAFELVSSSPCGTRAGAEEMADTYVSST